MPHPTPNPAPNPIGANLAAIRARIASAAQAAGRNPASVTLVAVSKTTPQSAVLAALGAGQCQFGENRVQEAATKFPGLRAEWPDLRLHLIGPVQTNKALDAVRIADVIETLDRPKLADAIARAADLTGRLPNLLVQINIGDEPQKSGAAWQDADDFIRACRQRFGANLRGLMGIAPLGADPAPYFGRLAATAAAHGLAELSIGMSGDFPAAIAAGATHVRIGSAIFGTR